MVVAADCYSYVLISSKIPVLYVRVWVYTCHTYGHYISICHGLLSSKCKVVVDKTQIKVPPPWWASKTSGSKHVPCVFCR